MPETAGVVTCPPRLCYSLFVLSNLLIVAERMESAAMPIHVWRGVLWGTALGDLSAITSLVKAPVLILWGDQDSLFDAAHQERLRQSCPAAQFEAFEGAGHNMFWEQPERAAKLISQFLNE